MGHVMPHDRTKNKYLDISHHPGKKVKIDKSKPTVTQ